MTENPSRYGGVAAVLVFGIGLLAVGKTRAGVGVLVLGIFAMLVVLAPSASGKALFSAIGAMIISGFLGYQAVSNEVNGKATYHRMMGRSSRFEEVTREASPAKFRAATNVVWAGSILSLLTGAVAFSFYRKLDGPADDF
jgi:hypothetical protein